MIYSHKVLRIYYFLGNKKYPLFHILPEDSTILPACTGSGGQGLDCLKPPLRTRNERLSGQTECDQHWDNLKPVWDKSNSKTERSPQQDRTAGFVSHLSGSELGLLAARWFHWSGWAEERKRGSSTCHKSYFMTKTISTFIFSTFQRRDWMKFCCFSPVIF